MSSSSFIKTGRQEAYLPPVTEIIVIKQEQSIMSGDDDDNTGGTGHNMPWDD